MVGHSFLRHKHSNKTESSADWRESHSVKRRDSTPPSLPSDLLRLAVGGIISHSDYSFWTNTHFREQYLSLMRYCLTASHKTKSCIICCCSVAKSCPTLCHPMTCSTLGSFVLHCLPEFAQIQVRWFSDAIQPSHPLQPLLLLPSVFPRIGVFSKESALCIKWPKCWSFSFTISPSNEYSGLISFSIDWFDLLAVQGVL